MDFSLKKYIEIWWGVGRSNIKVAILVKVNFDPRCNKIVKCFEIQEFLNYFINFFYLGLNCVRTTKWVLALILLM